MPSGPPGPELLSWVLDRHAAALELYARGICGHGEDVLQEALLELSRQRETPRDAVAWLYRVVRNKALSMQRAARRRAAREAAAAETRRAWFLPSHDEALDAAAAQQALEQLELPQRELLLARIWGGLSFAQIGQLVGCSQSAAHRRYEAALLAMREKLGVECTQDQTASRGATDEK